MDALVTDASTRYATGEIAPLTEGLVKVREAINQAVEPTYLADRRLARIVRLRLLGGPGDPRLELSYCWGQLRDGTYVNVDLPRHFFRRDNYRRDIVQMCKDENVYGKALGILDAVSVL